jgi:hypothetical protein
VRHQLSQVRAVLTDWGTEAAIADAPDILPWVMRSLTKRIKKSAHVVGKMPTLDYLFPRALMFPGTGATSRFVDG